VYNKFSSGDQIQARRRVGLELVSFLIVAATVLRSSSFSIYGMNTYNINKGIGERWSSRTESAVLVHLRRWFGMLILIMILYMTGVNSYLCLYRNRWGIAVIMANFFTEQKYGEHGFDESGAKKRHRYIICRKPVHRYFQLNSKCISHEK
jgi:hypothetical protein